MAEVIPLTEIEERLMDQDVDLAVNIHSFSECTIDAIEWWLSLLEKNEVQHLMIVPNAYDNGGRHLLSYERQDFSPLLEEHGYRLVARESKYKDPAVQEYGIDPTFHYLYEAV